MRMMRLSPQVAMPDRDRRRGWLLGVSLLLHALLLVALLTISRRPEEDEAGAPSYELMFDGGDRNAPAPPPAGAAADTPVLPATPPATPQPQRDVLPGPPTPPAEIPPAPDAPVVPPTPAPVPQVQPDTPPMAVTAEPPPVPTPVPTPLPEPAPTPPSRPDVRLETPPAPAPPLPLVPDLEVPQPPARPVPTPAPRPAPRPPVAPPRPRAPAAPPPLTGTFANPMDLNFSPAPTRLAAPRIGAARGSVASRSLDLSPGAPKGPNRAEAFFDVRAGKLGEDWQQSLRTYWLRHRYYPRQAAEDGEDGTVDLELTVDGSGKVRSAVVKSRSGSTWLDMAAVGTWQNAQLPPLPPELTTPYVFSITINYILIR